jgi:hypothetical protein
LSLRLTTVVPPWGACAVCLIAAGCCSPRQCEDKGTEFAKYRLNDASFAHALRTGSDARAEKVDMLVLSGGGSHGAWGAGVLRGWRENTVNPRPARFQVVTGVSTGAGGRLYHGPNLRYLPQEIPPLRPVFRFALQFQTAGPAHQQVHHAGGSGPRCQSRRRRTPSLRWHGGP